MKFRGAISVLSPAENDQFSPLLRADGQTLLSLPCDLRMPAAIDFSQSASQEVNQRNDISKCMFYYKLSGKLEISCLNLFLFFQPEQSRRSGGKKGELRRRKIARIDHSEIISFLWL